MFKIGEKGRRQYWREEKGWRCEARQIETESCGKEILKMQRGREEERKRKTREEDVMVTGERNNVHQLPY